MNSRKFRNITVVFFIGLFALTFQPVFIWLLVGSLVLLHPEGGDEKQSKKKNVIFQIGKDARNNGLNMPRSNSHRTLLVQVYENYNKAVKNYPHLEGEYSEVISEMWASLATDSSSEHWQQVIGSVLAGWPKQKSGPFDNMNSKLKKVKELSQQWDEAKNEALGGSSV